MERPDEQSSVFLAGLFDALEHFLGGFDFEVHKVCPSLNGLGQALFAEFCHCNFTHLRMGFCHFGKAAGGYQRDFGSRKKFIYIVKAEFAGVQTYFSHPAKIQLLQEFIQVFVLQYCTNHYFYLFLFIFN